MRRAAQSIEEHKASGITEGSEPKAKVSKRGKHPNSRKNLKPFPPGTSGNPGGLPGADLAALYARRLFEAHPEGISEELAESLKGFNAYAYSVLADRAYGKVKEVKEHQLVGADGGPIEFVVRFIEAKDGKPSA